MMKRLPVPTGFVLLTALLFAVSLHAESHRATRLGNPATRFAPPISTPDDLRSRFSDKKLKADFASVLRQWGWRGNLRDLHHAAATAEIEDIRIPVGTTMPFMSSRENGRAICLRNVLWAGKEPAPALAFNFSSNGRRYRCITPKACSNFFVEDIGPEPRSGLTISCTAPDEVLANRPAQLCLVVRNTGNIPEPAATVSLPIPAGATVTQTTDAGALVNGAVRWQIPALPAGGAKQICAYFVRPDPGIFSFDVTASSPTAPPVQTVCETKVTGLPAILIDAVDLEDPVEVGKQVIYEIKVTNQGSAPGTRVKLVCTLPASQEFVSGSGPTEVTAEGRTVRTVPLPVLESKGVATWRVVVKVIGAEDARFLVDLSSDQFEIPIHEQESTHQY